MHNPPSGLRSRNLIVLPSAEEMQDRLWNISTYTTLRLRLFMPLIDRLADRHMNARLLVDEMWMEILVYQGRYDEAREGLDFLLGWIPSMIDAVVSQTPQNALAHTAYSWRWRTHQNAREETKRLQRRLVRRRSIEEFYSRRRLARELNRLERVRANQQVRGPAGWSKSRKHHWQPESPWVRKR